MPSIGDVANEAKAILEDIRTNTLGTRNNTAQIATDVEAGFTNLAAGVQVLVQLGAQANDLAAEQVAQNGTIICWLDHIATMLCDIKRDLDATLVEDRVIRARVSDIDSVLQLVHAREALEVANRNRLQAEIEACCEPERPDPRPCFEPCDAPPIKPYRPIKGDWTPVNLQQSRPK